ncbi:hypothetical protein ACQSED_20630 [Salmonella enterica]|uniref:hypothetical protein n=1 Tax=Salmonella enterica TaxID=28901 RepID=UPI003D31B66C
MILRSEPFIDSIALVVYHLHFMQGKLQWIEVYSQGDKRWPFDPERYLADQE